MIDYNLTIALYTRPTESEHNSGMQSEKKSAKLAVILALWILLIAPMFYFQRLLSELAQKDESRLEILAHEQLINEMDKFQDSLSPSKYIETALEDLNYKFGFKSPDGQQRELSFATAIDPKLISPDFIADARRFLKLNYNLQPLFIVATDCDLQHSYFWSSLKLFPDLATQNFFTEAAVNSLAFQEITLQNQLSTTENLAERKNNYLEKNIAIDNTCHQIFSKLFRDNISPFTDPPMSPGRNQTFFSNKFGNQRSYQLFYRITRGNELTESLLGLYYCGFNSCDMPPTTMLRRSLEASSVDVKRHFHRHNLQQPVFHKENDKIYYFSGFPQFFFTAAEDLGIKNPQTRLKLVDFLQQHCMVTSIDANFLRSGYRQASRLTGAAIKLSLLLFFALVIKMLTGFKIGKIKLSNKLRMAVAVVVMLPVVGLFMVSELIKSGSEKLAIFNCQTQMRQRLQFFEKMVNESDPRLLMMFQDLKKTFAAHYFAETATSPLEMLQNVPFNKFPMVLISRFLDRDGIRIAFDQKSFFQGPSNEIVGLFRILADLDAVNISKKAIQDFQKQQIFLSTFTDAYWNVFATGHILAGESLFMKSFLSGSALKRSCYQLMANKSNPDKPEAILYSEIDDMKFMSRLLKQLGYQMPKMFSDYTEDHQIDYGLFLRGPTNLRTLQIPRSGPGMGLLRNIANKATEKRTSGSSVVLKNDQADLINWLYYDDIPVIIAARGIVNVKPAQQLFFLILPLALLAYAVIAIALLSETLADALLAPVQVLSSFVKSIQKNLLNVKADIKSGDEFADLASSFNRMSTGLCQREKMRRFVSERLYKSLESPVSEKSTGKTMVTILSSDIRGFTSISEQNQPEEIVSLLNDYFSLMETAIIANGGSIEKIIGDAVVAAFYNEEGQECNAIRACKAAIGMKKLLVEFNLQRQQMQKFSIETGIGLATGEAVFGFAGSSARRREFVLVGEVIQNAETLESMTRKGIDSKIFVDQATVELVQNHITLCPLQETDSDLFYRELKNE